MTTPMVTRQRSTAGLLWIVFGSIGWAGFLGIAASRAEPPPAPSKPVLAEVADAVDFARDVRPLLVERCGGCHGSKRQESGLRLDSAVAIRAGGDSGPATIAGDPARSLLLQRVTSGDKAERMPPEGPGLDAAQIELLRRWIAQGAVVPDDAGAAVAATVDHWAFRRPVRSTPPAVENQAWPRGAVDRFILARLERPATADRPDRPKISPAPDADRATLLRRASLDLTGLPPSADEQDEFLRDQRPDAYERLIDRLLASPAYGERWGRVWLDQARYADSNGYTRDFGREIWLFRQWVLDALNRDLPFDQFTVEQIAGDLLPGATNEQRTATGFHRNTLINEEGGVDQEQFRVDAVADRVATTGQVWLGLTLGCARCHNHKYDPISQREYYQLFAFLNSCDEPTIEAPLPLNLERGDLERRAAIRRQIDEIEKALDARRAELEARQRAWEATVTPEQRARLPGPVQVAFDMPFEKRDEPNKRQIEQHYRQSEQGRRDFPQLDQIAQLRASEPQIPRTMVLSQRAEPRKTFIHKRGDFLNPGVEVRPGVPAVLHPIAASSPATSSPATSSPTRLDFARWLVDPANPLTARVVMNRHWQQLFGRGLVETEDDFGLAGQRPTHPELLDWLAIEFQEAPTAWSTKRMFRLLTTSATYRQSSRARAELADVDPRNDLLARQSRLRLDAELVRDAALAAGGLLTRELGGPSVMPPQPDGVYAFTQDPKPWQAATDGRRYRRGMYTFFWRSLPFPMLTTFDAPTANVTCTRRLRSNTPLQSLTLANDQVFVEAARALARRVLRESSGPLDQQARHAFRLCLGRDPQPTELDRFAALVQQQRSAYSADPPSAAALADAAPGKEEPGKVEPVAANLDELAAWIAASRVLLNLDEFITRE